MNTGDHLSTLVTEGRTLARTVEGADWDAPVPTCPGWSVRDLVVHLGGVHRWATAFVAEERTEPTSREERAAFGEHPADRHLVAWFSDGHEALVDALTRADPGLRCWTLWPGVPAREFWARRQAHETLVHRIDAELATGTTPTRVDPATAADGLAELVVDFLPVRAVRRLTADPPRTVAVEATDTGDRWTLRITPDGPVAGSPDDADLTLRGTAADLHRMLWNRGEPDGVTVDGDPEVWELWRTGARI